MIGAIIGDIVGSCYEFHSIHTTDFPLINHKYSRFTDDTVMTIAVADALINNYGKDDDSIRRAVVCSMQEFGKRYPHAGYGGSFSRWIYSSDPQPYNSWGNGSAMRVAFVGWIASSIEEAMHLAKLTAEVTHNHEEGIKGAQAVAVAIYMALHNSTKEQIQEYISTQFGYDLETPLDEIRPTYSFDVSCQGSVPQAIRAFLEADNYEEAIRLAISLGGDSDTQACIAGAIAEAYYEVPERISNLVLSRLDRFLMNKIVFILSRLQYLGADKNR